VFSFQSRYMPCPDCGASLTREDSADHECERERWLDYQMFQLRFEVTGLDDEVAAYLASARGRFEAWCAERERRRGYSSSSLESDSPIFSARSSAVSLGSSPAPRSSSTVTSLDV
jgi:hypothetical protein